MTTETKKDKSGTTHDFQGKAVEIFISALHESPFNPRKNYPDAQMKELAESIKAHGVLSPILVRPRKGTANVNEIVYGHRRARAATMAGLQYIPAIIREMDDQTVMEIQIIENLQRQDIEPMDEARGFEALLKSGKYQVKDVAVKFGKSTSYVRGRFQMVNLITQAITMLEKKEMPLSVALELCKLEKGIQVEALKNCLWEIENRPADAINGIRNHVHQPLSKAIFDTKDSYLDPKAGSCDACPYRTGNQPDLYQDVKKDICTKPSCYKAKTTAHNIELVKQWKDAGNEIMESLKVGEAIFDKRTHVELDSECSDDPKSRTWRQVLGRDAENQNSIPHICGIMPKNYSGRRGGIVSHEDRPVEIISRSLALKVLREKGVAWAKPAMTPSRNDNSKTPEQRKKEELAKKVDEQIEVNLLGLVGAANAVNVDFMNVLFRKSLENSGPHGGMPGKMTPEQIKIARAFGEDPTVPKYVGPWEEKRINKLPPDQLRRLWAICQVTGSIAPTSTWRPQPAGWMKEWFDLVGLDLRKARKEIGDRMATELNLPKKKTLKERGIDRASMSAKIKEFKADAKARKTADKIAQALIDSDAPNKLKAK